MLEQATFLSLKLEFENMVMSMLIGNPENKIFSIVLECHQMAQVETHRGQSEVVPARR